MSIRKLNPYLNYDGTAEKAIQLYQSALGARVESMQRFGDIPGNTPAPEHKDRVIHALLQLGEGTIMISDSMPGVPVPPGGNMHVCLDFTDAADMNRKFEALSAGGKVTMPLQDTFWGARFGMLVDAHGINWMFNCELRPRTSPPGSGGG
jgi:PhnB protein